MNIDYLYLFNRKIITLFGAIFAEKMKHRFKDV